MEQHTWTDRHPLITATLACVASAVHWYVNSGPQSTLQTARVAVLLAIPLGVTIRAVQRSRAMQPDAALATLRGALGIAMIVALSFLVLV